MKEAELSVLERFTTKASASNHGQQVGEGQRLMQAASDIFLGWQRVTSPGDGVARDFYVRQLWDWKASSPVDTMEPEVLGIYAGMCASTLADAHARSGDEIALGAYLSSKPGVRPGPGGLCQFLCGPERHRSPGAHRCRQGRRPGR